MQVTSPARSPILHRKETERLRKCNYILHSFCNFLQSSSKFTSPQMLQVEAWGISKSPGVTLATRKQNSELRKDL